MAVKSEVRIFTGTTLRTWEWTDDDGTIRRITWVIGSDALLYGVRAGSNSIWDQRVLDRRRWSVARGTFASAQQRVEEFLASREGVT